MGVINQLPIEISNKIAAGEVVERPASVIKELVENSIDAGATVITVEIERGGTSFMRVTDNGCGMSEEDAKLCFMRHATSKIKTASDLDAIYTLGFRGEAMSSIGAVSKIDLITKRAGDSGGTAVSFCGGELLGCNESGAADGTTIVVRELFYNTPARMKFLKKDSTEAGYIADIISRFILAHPEISFRLIKDGKEQYFTPGDNNVTSALYAIYGREYAKAAIEVDYELDGIHVSGIAGKGETARANRSYQSYFINRRYVKSAVITRAVEEAYKNQIMIGKFPMAALNIEIDPHNIDINVHPTKLEVKFSNDSDIYRAVFHAVKNAIYALPHVPEIERVKEEQPKQELPREAAAWERVKLPTQKGGFGAYERKPHFEQKKVDLPMAAPAPEREKLNVFILAPKEKPEIQPAAEKAVPHEASAESSSYSINTGGAKTEEEYFKRRQEQFCGIEAEPLSELRSQQEEIQGIEALPHDFRVIGQVFATYILVEAENSLLMIDQHAAHERIKYEELKQQLAERKITAQMLIAPVPIRLSPVEADLCNEYKDALFELGFGFEEKKGEYFITEVPAPMSENELIALFIELLTALEENHHEVISKAKERLTYTIACKAAIKANHKFTDIEMYDLVHRVFELPNINTCPHGRPIVIKMSKHEIEKEFGRTL